MLIFDRREQKKHNQLLKIVRGVHLLFAVHMYHDYRHQNTETFRKFLEASHAVVYCHSPFIIFCDSCNNCFPREFSYSFFFFLSYEQHKQKKNQELGKKEETLTKIAEFFYSLLFNAFLHNLVGYVEMLAMNKLAPLIWSTKEQ